MTPIQTDDNGKYAKVPKTESEVIQRQKKYGFKADKWITIREKNMFGML